MKYCIKSVFELLFIRQSLWRIITPFQPNAAWDGRGAACTKTLRHQIIENCPKTLLYTSRKQTALSPKTNLSILLAVLRHHRRQLYSKRKNNILYLSICKKIIRIYHIPKMVSKYLLWVVLFLFKSISLQDLLIGRLILPIHIHIYSYDLVFVYEDQFPEFTYIFSFETSIRAS